MQRLQSTQRGAACAGGIPVGHDMDPGLLLFSLRAHASSHRLYPPRLKIRRYFERAAPDEKRVGIEQVCDLIEEQAKRARLGVKNRPAHLIAAFGVSANLLGG